MIQNWSTAESVLETAQNASGSALAENSKYLQSISGHIARLTSSFQNLWANAIPTDTIKGFVDLGTSILNIVDDLGLARTAAIAFATAMTFKGAGGANFFLLHKKERDSRPHYEDARNQ